MRADRDFCRLFLCNFLGVELLGFRECVTLLKPSGQGMKKRSSTELHE